MGCDGDNDRHTIQEAEGCAFIKFVYQTRLSVIIQKCDAFKLKLDYFLEEVPPPTSEEIGIKLSKRLVILCQKGEWDAASETLKVNRTSLLTAILKLLEFENLL